MTTSRSPLSYVAAWAGGPPAARSVTAARASAAFFTKECLIDASPRSPALGRRADGRVERAGREGRAAVVGAADLHLVERHDRRVGDCVRLHLAHELQHRVAPGARGEDRRVVVPALERPVLVRAALDARL